MTRIKKFQKYDSSKFSVASIPKNISNKKLDKKNEFRRQFRSRDNCQFSHKHKIHCHQIKRHINMPEGP